MSQAGGVFVDRAARILLEQKLASSKFNDEEYLGLMIHEFEKKVTQFRAFFDLIANAKGPANFIVLSCPSLFNWLIS
jgi:hypothetical protein